MQAKTSLRQVGGSVAMVIPPIFLKQLHINVGTEMNISTSGKGLLIEPVKNKPKYSLEELLAQSDFEMARNAESEEWLNAPNVGEELL